MNSIITSYKTKSKDAGRIAARIEMLVARHKKVGITPENMFGIVSGIVTEVHNIRGLTGPDKKALVVDLVHSVVEQIDEGEKDSELEKILKDIVPPMIDALVAMLKVNNRCGCF